MASWPWLKRWAVTKALLFPSSSWSCTAWQSLMAQEVDSSEGAAAPRPRLVVRSVAGEETMRLSASLRGRTHSLLRDKSEPVLKALKRVAIAAAKSEKNVKSKKRHAHTATDDGSAADAPIEAQLHVGSCSGPAVSGELPNSLAWVEDNVLLVGGVEYNIRVNPPTVLSLRLPDFVMSGCPIVPKVELEFAELSSCRWTWSCYGNPNPQAELAALVAVDSGGILPRLPSLSEDQLTSAMTELYLHKHPSVCSSFIYCPKDGDFGRQFLLQCTPGNAAGCLGEPAFVASRPVMHFPPATPIARRHQHTPGFLAAPLHFRVLTYNILAEPYASTPYAQQQLYPYCHPDALDLDYRQCLIAHELLGYHGDVLCLQEVGSKSFAHFLEPALEEKGYRGVFCEKSGQVREGEAIFYRPARFSLASSCSTNLATFLQTDQACADILTGLQAAPAFLRSLTTKPTIALVAFLKCRDFDSHYVCVITTHLYFHPLGDHVRLVQTALTLRFAEKAITEFRNHVGNCTMATVFCGDLNSCPCIAAYSFITSGLVAADDTDWQLQEHPELNRCRCGCVAATEPATVGPPCEGEGEGLAATEHRPDIQDALGGVDNGSMKPKEYFTGLELHHSFQFQNVTGTSGYTNFTQGFRGLLDYIFIDADWLEAERVVPLPSHAEVTECVALPSIYFPSDHLALIADLKWREGLA